jgi:hypothetical protein
MVLYEIYREDGRNGITFVHMLYMETPLEILIIIFTAKFCLAFVKKVPISK